MLKVVAKTPAFDIDMTDVHFGEYDARNDGPTTRLDRGMRAEQTEMFEALADHGCVVALLTRVVIEGAFLSSPLRKAPSSRPRSFPAWILGDATRDAILGSGSTSRVVVVAPTDGNDVLICRRAR